MNYANVCRRLTPFLLIGCLSLAAFTTTVTILSLRRTENYSAARRPVEEHRRALQMQIEDLQRQADLPVGADTLVETEAAAPKVGAENAPLVQQIEALRQERLALYDQRRTIMAGERADSLLRFHDFARMPLIHLQILCLSCLVASRLLEMALASTPRRALTGMSRPALKTSTSTN